MAGAEADREEERRMGRVATVGHVNADSILTMKNIIQITPKENTCATIGVLLKNPVSRIPEVLGLEVPYIFLDFYSLAVI